MHGTYRSLVLFKRSLERAAAFVYVAFEPAYQTHVVRRVDEHTHIQKVEDPRFGKYQNSLDDHNRFRLDGLDLVAARVRHKIVKRHVDRPALLETHNVV